jgi:hypothetical protein
VTYQKDDAIDLANCLREAADNYFNDDMNALFEERIARNESINRFESEAFSSRNVINWRISA